MTDQPLISAVDWVVNVLFVISVMFPVATAMFWPWWETWWGRNIVSFEIVLAGAVFPDVLLIDFHLHLLDLEWIQVIFLSLCGMVTVWRAVMIWRTQRAAARKAAYESEAPSSSSV